MKRLKPNILVTGTPGTGKTTACDLIASATKLKHINVGERVKAEELHNGWDDAFRCFVIDEDKVCDALEDELSQGGCIVDYHGCDFFPERWFDLVIVLQTENGILWERLEKRGYAVHKIQENVECEIMHVIVEEARDSYKEDIVHVVPSNSTEDMENTVEHVVQWVSQWV